MVWNWNKFWEWFKDGKDTLPVEVNSNSNQEIFWNNKRPKADITYKGRTLPTTKDMFEIDVKLFLQPNDFEIYNWLKLKGLLVKDINRCNDTILKIYKEHQKQYFYYKSDQETYGVAELWAYPAELRALRRKGKGEDCDTFGISLASHYICAGVPAYRVRCVAGNTRRGEGHLTVYVLGDDLKTWYHTNSTTSYQYIPSSLDKLPNSKTNSDKIGIDSSNVWFSFNNQFSWHQFITDSAEKSFNKYKDKFKIIPVN